MQFDRHTRDLDLSPEIRMQLFDALPAVVRDALAHSPNAWNSCELHWMLLNGYPASAVAWAINTAPMLPWPDGLDNPAIVLGLKPIR